MALPPCVEVVGAGPWLVITASNLRWLFDEQLLNEFLGFLRHIVKEFVIKVVVDCRDVQKRLLVCLTLEWGVARNPVREGRVCTCEVIDRSTTIYDVRLCLY